MCGFRVWLNPSTCSQAKATSWESCHSKIDPLNQVAKLSKCHFSIMMHHKACRSSIVLLCIIWFGFAAGPAMIRQSCVSRLLFHWFTVYLWSFWRTWKRPKNEKIYQQIDCCTPTWRSSTGGWNHGRHFGPSLISIWIVFPTRSQYLNDAECHSGRTGPVEVLPVRYQHHLEDRCRDRQA